ncbi:MAG TPA: AAA family ATPase, partial [Polyangiaceae bacterium]
MLSTKPHTLYLVPSGHGVGLTSVALGVVRALDRRGVRVAFYKPIAQHAGRDTGPEHSTAFVRKTSALTPASPLPFDDAERLHASGRTDELFDRVMRGFHESLGKADVAVVEGLVDAHDTGGEAELNRELVRTLSAEVILVGALGDTPLAEFEERLERTASRYGGFGAGRVVGTIVNRVPIPERSGRTSVFPALPTPKNPLTR